MFVAKHRKGRTFLLSEKQNRKIDLYIEYASGFIQKDFKQGV